MKKAILIVDLAGFTAAITESLDGALILVEQLHIDAGLAINGNGGMAWKYSGDNVFGLFPEVVQAIAAAKTIRKLNKRACIAVGFGNVRYAFADYFGLEVNDTSRLAEDVAKAGDLFLTQGAADRIGAELNREAEFKGRTIRWAAI